MAEVTFSLGLLEVYGPRALKGRYLENTEYHISLHQIKLVIWHYNIDVFRPSACVIHKRKADLDEFGCISICRTVINVSYAPLFSVYLSVYLPLSLPPFYHSLSISLSHLRLLWRKAWLFDLCCIQFSRSFSYRKHSDTWNDRPMVWFTPDFTTDLNIMIHDIYALCTFFFLFYDVNFN